MLGLDTVAYTISSYLRNALAVYISCLFVCSVTGKTESTKFLVQQIAHLCNYSSGNLQEKILQVSDIQIHFVNRTWVFILARSAFCLL